MARAKPPVEQLRPAASGKDRSREASERPPSSSEDQLERTFDAVPDLIMILDTDHRIVRANRAMAEGVDRSPEELEGLRCCEVVHGTEDPPDFCPHARLLGDRQEHVAEVTEPRLHGRFQVSVTPLFAADGTLTGSVHVARDITARWEAEEALARSHAELDQRVAERSAELERARAALQERFDFEALIARLSSRFISLPAPQVDREIEDGLGEVVAFLGADRASLGHFSADRKDLFITHSHAVNGTRPVEPVNAAELTPWAASMWRRGEIIQFACKDEVLEVLQDSASDLGFATAMGIESHISVPIPMAGTIEYVLAVDSTTPSRTWSEELPAQLRLLGEVFANALGRRRADQEQQEAYAEISRLKDRLESDSVYLQEEIKLEHDFEDMIGDSDALRYVLHKVEQIAPADTTALILGESGTGKELVARAIHAASPRSRRPLVKLNCATLPANLVESELFGHERGAFTGAEARREGRFEIADGATLFLDEIGELPLELQPKLLQVLQEGELQRVGGNRTITVDVRIIAATNRNLEAEVDAGRFRQDLWYRLNVFPITLPPLRSRPGDIPLLASSFAARFAKIHGKKIQTIPRRTMKALERYHWPGNVRELENVIERAILTSSGPSLQLAEPLTSAKPGGARAARRTLEEVERDHVIEVLEASLWRIEGSTGAAAVLGLNPSTLRSRMRKLDIRRPD